MSLYFNYNGTMQYASSAPMIAAVGSQPRCAAVGGDVYVTGGYSHTSWGIAASNAVQVLTNITLPTGGGGGGNSSSCSASLTKQPVRILQSSGSD